MCIVLFCFFFLELFIMKEGLCAVMPGLYGDWSPYVSGKHHNLCIRTIHLWWQLMLIKLLCAFVAGVGVTLNGDSLFEYVT